MNTSLNDFKFDIFVFLYFFIYYYFIYLSATRVSNIFVSSDILLLTFAW